MSQIVKEFCERFDTEDPWMEAVYQDCPLIWDELLAQGPPTPEHWHRVSADVARHRLSMSRWCARLVSPAMNVGEPMRPGAALTIIFASRNLVPPANSDFADRGPLYCREWVKGIHTLVQGGALPMAPIDEENQQFIESNMLFAMALSKQEGLLDSFLASSEYFQTLSMTGLQPHMLAGYEYALDERHKAIWSTWLSRWEHHELERGVPSPESARRAPRL